MTRQYNSKTFDEDKKVAAEFFQDSQSFLEEVEKVIESGSDYLDAIMHVCSRRNVDPDAAVGIIRNNKQFKAKLAKEAAELKLLK